LRRADRMMSEQRAYEMLAHGFSGQLATVGEDGYPYCIPLLYIWLDGEVHVHTSSAKGHFRANLERERRVCFEIDEPDQVFDYGRFECDSGLAYKSVILFGKIRIVEEKAAKQQFCEALMAKYGKPDTGRPKGFFPRIDMITVYARDRAPDRQGNGLACALRAVAGERQNQNAERAAVRGSSVTGTRFRGPAEGAIAKVRQGLHWRDFVATMVVP